MTLIDQKRRYEVLIRYGLDGSLQGAHVQYLRYVELDGEVLKQEPLDAEPLAIDGFDLSDTMTGVAQDALARANELQAENEALQRDAEAMAARVKAAEEQRDDSAQKLDEQAKAFIEMKVAYHALREKVGADA